MGIDPDKRAAIVADALARYAEQVRLLDAPRERLDQLDAVARQHGEQATHHRLARARDRAFIDRIRQTGHPFQSSTDDQEVNDE